ncbi:MFS transporter [Rhodococcus sp. NPDC059234]|uniref:MFS transporter n=1 Tax=Rhodococcus sp. NPDC059234 TaxID=3346781 RepID=UPI00366E51EF
MTSRTRTQEDLVTTAPAETTPTPDRPPRPTPRQWAALGVLVVPTLIIALDLNVLFLALPQLEVDLHPSASAELWITDIYGFVLAGLLITMGSLGDRVGRRRLLMVGAAGFAAASVLAAYATDPAVLIAARALMGVCAATLMPSTLGLIAEVFPDEQQRARAIATWATCQFAGAAFGPVLGGILLDHFWWGSVFLLNVPVVAILLVAAPALLPETGRRVTGRIAPVDVATSLLSILALVYAIKSGFLEHRPAAAVAATVVGLAAGALFVHRQLRAADPMLDVRLLGRRDVRAVIVALVLAGVVLAGVGFQVTQYLQVVIGLSPSTAALYFVPMGLGVAAGTMLSPLLSARVAPRIAIAGGLLLSAAGSACLFLVSTHGVAAALVAITLLGFGTGPLFACGTALIIGSVAVERAGSAASLSETANSLGGTLGIALLGTLAGVVSARSTAAAPDAFVAGVHAVGIAGAVLLGALALSLPRLTRR